MVDVVQKRLDRVLIERLDGQDLFDQALFEQFDQPLRRPPMPKLPTTPRCFILSPRNWVTAGRSPGPRLETDPVAKDLRSFDDAHRVSGNAQIDRVPGDARDVETIFDGSPILSTLTTVPTNSWVMLMGMTGVSSI